MAIKNVASFSKNCFVKSRDLKIGTYKLRTSFRPTRARALGYKNVPYYLLVISSIRKGGIEARIPSRGRTPSKIYSKFSRNISLQRILEGRTKRRFLNLTLVGSYPIYQNGKRRWYEFLFRDYDWKPLDIKKDRSEGEANEGSGESIT